MEKDDEITGSTGSTYTTEFRMLDTRLGRWWSVDPESKLYPNHSNYIYSGNNPILFIDPDGDYYYAYTKKQQRQTIKLMKTTFGKNHGFSFNASGQLIAGSVSFQWSKEQRLLHGLFVENIVNSSADHIEFRGKNQKSVNISGRSFPVIGAAGFLNPSKRITYVAINNNKGIVPPLYDDGTSSAPSIDLMFWHEIGHPIANALFTNITDQFKFTIDFENLAGEILEKGYSYRSGSTHQYAGRFDIMKDFFKMNKTYNNYNDFDFYFKMWDTFRNAAPSTPSKNIEYDYTEPENKLYEEIPVT